MIQCDALAALGQYPQFVLYRIVPSADRVGKYDKLPIDIRTMQVGNAHDPGSWTDINTAVQTAQMCGGEYGVGFVFTPNDPFWFVDIDDCLMPDNTWSPVAQALVAALPGAAIEVSQSGRGLHIIGSGQSPDHGCRNQALGLEFYTEGRFVALTGTNAVGDSGLDCTAMLPAVVDYYFPPSEQGTNEEWRDTPVEEWVGPEDDDILIQKMLASKPSAGSAFGYTATIPDLWNNNEHALAQAFPTNNDRDPYDRSSADASLSQHLAWWTGKNHARMERLMRRSGLVRSKWDSHAKYLGMTITAAVNQQEGVAKLKVPKTQQIEIDHDMKIDSGMKAEVSYIKGNQVLMGSMIADLFEGCVYVRDQHRIWTPDGALLKPEQFKAVYGGYTFMMDAENSKTSRNAYEAFTECQTVSFPKVNNTCFRPRLPSGTIVKEEGMSLINKYIPIETKRRKGDVTPFLNHIRKLFPNDRDYRIVINFLAALVQYPGVKFQFALMIQGAEGNGKTFISTCVANAIGHRYTHLPKATEIDSKFNGWVDGKMFACIEEIYTPDRRDVLEGMKPLITNSRIEIQRKGQDQFTGDNFVNFIINTNHKDGIPITADTRRYAPLYCAQQNAEDIKRDFPGTYFPDLYNWASSDEGYPAITEFLMTHQIEDEFNPATICTVAPHTSSTLEAIQLSMGSIEQEIMAAVEEDRPGFTGGWVSSFALDKLLKELRAERKVPRNKRKDMMLQLGYIHHPGLPGGRANNIIPSEGCKPKLFIRKDHQAVGLKEAADIIQLYTETQSYPAMTWQQVPKLGSEGS